MNAKANNNPGNQVQETQGIQTQAKQTAKQSLHTLLADPQIWRASDAVRSQACARQTYQPIGTGFSALDQQLPDGGWPQHGLMELLCPRWGTGEIPLFSPAMAQLSQQGRWLAWVSPPWLPYAPGLVHAGIQVEQLLIIQPKSDKDALWAMEECLQSGLCSAVLGWPRRPLPQQLKRLHIAAQKGDSLGVLMRNEDCAQQPSPAPLRIQMGPLQPGLSVRILKRRGSWASDWLKLPLPDCLTALAPSASLDKPSLVAAKPAMKPTTKPYGDLAAIPFPATGLTTRQPATNQSTQRLPH